MSLYLLGEFWAAHWGEDTAGGHIETIDAAAGSDTGLQCLYSAAEALVAFRTANAGVDPDRIVLVPKSNKEERAMYAFLKVFLNGDAPEWTPAAKRIAAALRKSPAELMLGDVAPSWIINTLRESTGIHSNSMLAGLGIGALGRLA